MLVVTDTQTGGVHAQAALKSIDDRGFTLDWTESDGKPRQFGYVALGRLGSGNPVSRVPSLRSRVTRARPGGRS